MLALVAQFLGLTPLALALKSGGIVLLIVGYLGATWTAYNQGEGACEARHVEAARRLQLDLDAKSAVWRQEVADAAAAAEALNKQTEVFADANAAIDASRANCAGPGSMRYLNSIR